LAASTITKKKKKQKKTPKETPFPELEPFGFGERKGEMLGAKRKTGYTGKKKPQYGPGTRALNAGIRQTL